LAAVRSLTHAAVVLLACITLAAGCGEKEEKTASAPGTTAPRAGTPPQANAAYERAYSDCASFSVRRLAKQYKVAERPAAVARAVGDAWAKRLGGGQATASYGEAGCREGFKARTGEA
jgi:hypothetical protein